MPVAAVIIDIGAGHAHVGDQVIDVAPVTSGPAGSLAVGRLVLRPLTFGERLRLVREVAGGPVSTDSARALAASVLSASLVTGDAADAEFVAATESVALHLAGARLDVTSPGFADSAGLLAQAYGWSAVDVTDAAADLIDDLARSVAAVGDPADDGWTSVVLAGDTEVAAASAASIESEDVEGIRDRLAMDLLRRDAALFSANSRPQSGRPWPVAEQNGVGASTAESEQESESLPPGSGPSAVEAAPSAQAAHAQSRVPTNHAEGLVPSGRAAASPQAGDAGVWSELADPDRRFTALRAGRRLDLHRQPQNRVTESPPAATAFSPSVQPIAAGPAWSAPVALALDSVESGRSAQPLRGASAARPDVAHSTDVDAPADRLRAATGIAPSVASPSAQLDTENGDLFDLADRLADALNDEADLRGLRP